jgi:hypothetical protein
MSETATPISTDEILSDLLKEDEALQEAFEAEDRTKEQGGSWANPELNGVGDV